MFSRIVPRYDLMNALMTFGLDRSWRRIAAREADVDSDTVALDLACGTGDLALELATAGAGRVVGVDFCPEMLAVARQKIERAGASSVELVEADALRLPFASATFDVVTVGFGLRNFADVPAGLAEIARVLKPGGRLVCLEMTHPPFEPFGWLFRPYFHFVVPLVGGLVSGDHAAYRYLPRSVERFPDAIGLAGLCRTAGFGAIRYRYLALGAVALHVAYARFASGTGPVDSASPESGSPPNEAPERGN